jgi:hypothetical protein
MLDKAKSVMSANNTIFIADCAPSVYTNFEHFFRIFWRRSPNAGGASCLEQHGGYGNATEQGRTTSNQRTSPANDLIKAKFA